MSKRSDMNEEIILRVADIIEAEAHTDCAAESGFTMTHYTHRCGTPACIAGWTVAVGNSDSTELTLDNYYDPDIFDIAKDMLGVTDEIADELFLLWNWSGTSRLREITPQQAANVLRNMVTTGEVDWTIAGFERMEI